MYYVKSKEYLVDEDNDTIDYDTIIEIDLEETEDYDKAKKVYDFYVNAQEIYKEAFHYSIELLENDNVIMSYK